MGNFVAILVAAIVTQAIGMFWYSKSAFGKQWMSLMGYGDKKMKELQKEGMGKMMVTAFVANLVTAYVLSIFIGAMGAGDFKTGAVVGFWVWLGFVATVMINSVLWENKPMKLYQINVAYQLVNFLVIGGILAAWG